MSCCDIAVLHIDILIFFQNPFERFGFVRARGTRILRRRGARRARDRRLRATRLRSALRNRTPFLTPRLAALKRWGDISRSAPRPVAAIFPKCSIFLKIAAFWELGTLKVRKFKVR